MINNMYFFHVNYPLCFWDFSKILILWTDFRQNTQISNFIQIRPVKAELFYVDWHTTRHDKTNLQNALATAETKLWTT
jgi:hypothetical protein